MKNLKVGIQLYSLRAELEKDMDSTLKRVSEMGYECVEFAGFYGKTADEIKGLLDKYGLEAVSMHQSLDPYLSENADEFIKFVKTLGIKYSAVPWMDKAVFHDKEKYPEFVENMKKAGKLLADNGIALYYHNHDFEFEKEDGEYVLDRLYNDVSADLLKVELDLCWVKYGGEDPVKYINKYGNRSKIVHCKDFYAKRMGGGPVYNLIDENGNPMAPASREDNCFKYMPLGKGVQDFAPIFEAVQNSDIEYVIYEKDDWYDADPFEEARISREYLKNTFGI